MHPTSQGAIDPSPPSVTLESFSRVYSARRRRQQTTFVVVSALVIAALVISARVSQFSIPELADGLPNAWHYIVSTLPPLHPTSIGGDLREWYWNIGPWLALLAETALMSYVGTVLGAAGAFALCFAASRNLVRGRLVYFLSRRMLEVARTVPEIVFAMIFVFAFGIGPLSGILALTVHTMGALGKLFAEINEGVDRKPIESLEAAGGSWLTVIRLAVIPQVLPNFLSYTLIRFEYNVRGASVLGIVGAGGIGQELYLAIRQFDYPDISAIVFMIIAVVMMADLSCEALRDRLIGRDVLGRR